MKLTSNDIARFYLLFFKTDADACWNWKSNGKKYPHFAVNGRTENANRVSWTIHFGEIPYGQEVCHSCDNKRCVNPKHLFLGTHQENMDDHYSKPHRVNPAVGERNRHAKLTLADIEFIRVQPLSVSNISLAEKYCVTKKTICDIRRNITWKDPRLDALKNVFHVEKWSNRVIRLLLQFNWTTPPLLQTAADSGALKEALVSTFGVSAGTVRSIKFICPSCPDWQEVRREKRRRYGDNGINPLQSQ